MDAGAPCVRTLIDLAGDGHRRAPPDETCSMFTAQSYPTDDLILASCGPADDQLRASDDFLSNGKLAI